MTLTRISNIVKSFAIAAFGMVTMSFTPKSIKTIKPPNTPIYSIDLTSLSGDKIDLSEFKGKKILFVNVASKCGYTPQYKDLQKLHEQHGSELVIIGLPCNQFLKQEPGSAEEIQGFCKKNYGVTFLMTEKIEVKGKNKHPLYQWLTKKSMNGNLDSEVRWNFQKYLVNEKGELQQFFSSGTNPLDDKVISAIKK